MKKCVCVFLILSALFLQGCDKDDLIIEKGTIHYEGRDYQLNNATKTTSKDGLTAIIDDYVIHTFTHKLHFSSTDGKNDVIVLIGHSQKIPIDDENALIGPKNIELSSGNCFEYSMNITTVYSVSIGYSIQAEIILKLADDNDDENLNYSPPMNLVYTKKGDIFEIELKYIDSERDFFIKWEGILKEVENQ